MTKRQALRTLGLLTGGLLALQTAAAAHFRHHGRPKLAKWLLAGGLASDGILLYSSLVPNFPLTGQVFWRGRVSGNKIALTFDDGPREPYTGRILDVLKREGVPATFFVLGDNARRHPTTVKRIEAEGHRVGNHGLSHDILMFAGGSHALAEVKATDELLREAGVLNPAPLYRAPHGWLSPFAYRAIRAAGYRVVGWTKGVWDTANPGVEVIESRASEILVPGTVLLLHDGFAGETGEERAQTAAALPGIIRMARARGLEFVTVEEMMREA